MKVLIEDQTSRYNKQVVEVIEEEFVVIADQLGWTIIKSLGVTEEGDLVILCINKESNNAFVSSWHQPLLN